MDLNLTSEMKLPAGLFDNPLPVVRVLYEAEQPVVYLTRTKFGQEMLAYLAAETADEQFIILSPLTSDGLSKLESGAIAVREAITSSWMWLAKENVQDSSVEVWAVNESLIPAGHLPLPHTPLLPIHRTVFSARAVGEGISVGRVPCSVVSYVADAARSSLKAIFDYVMDVKTEGRPTDAQRALYDLPVKQLRFASFEVSLAEPAGDLFQQESIEQALTRLQQGLEWAERTDGEDLALQDEAEIAAVLRATLALTPPTAGAITSMEIGGAWLNGKRYHLNRNARTKVSRRLRALKDEEIVIYEGRIGEIDDDKLSFTLRDASDAAEHRGTFAEDLLDDMRSYYYEATRIEISGLVRRGKLKVTAVVPKVEEQASLPAGSDLV